MKYTHDIIILGGGAGGLTTASGCVQLGMKTALVELEQLGGDCLHYGCVPSKTLIRIAQDYAMLKNPPAGLPRPEIKNPSIKTVMTQVRKVINTIAVHDSVERFTNLGVEVFFARPKFTSPQEITLESEGGIQELSAKRIVIATGSSTRQLPIPGLAKSNYLTNVEIFSLSRLPKTLLIIGGGPIGIELAQAFARLGSRVIIVETAPRILIKEDPDVAEFIQKTLQAEGIDIRVGTSIKMIKNAKTGKRIILNTKEQITCSEILLTAGRKGNTDLLALENAGITLNNTFIEVDSCLRTSVKHILAIGDVNGRQMFTHVAGAEGSVAVQRLGLGLRTAMNYHHIPRVTYSDPEIASIGLSQTEADKQGIHYKIHIQNMDSVDRAHAEGATQGYLKLLLNNNDRILGAVLIAKHAGELFTPLIYAVRKGWKISELRTMYPYPIMSEISGKAASSYLAPRLFNPKVRGILRLLKRYRGNGPIES